MFQESVQHHPQNTRAMLGLARLSYQRGERDICSSQLTKILLADPLAEEAAELLSEVLFQKAEAAAAAPGGNQVTFNPLRVVQYSALSNNSVLTSGFTAERFLIAHVSEQLPQIEVVARRYSRYAFTGVCKHSCHTFSGRSRQCYQAAARLFIVTAK